MSSISAIIAFGSLVGVAAAGAPSCSASAPISCQNTTAITDTCCTEVQGQVLQVQFWDADPATGPKDSWTIHGLWPDFCDGSYEQYCDDSRDHYNISCILEDHGATDILDFMQTYWKDYEGEDESFWEHEWNKHGTCYSTLNPDCYTDYQPQDEVVDFFNQTITLFQTLPTYEWLADAGIVPSSSTNYTYDDIMLALRAARGVNATLSCSDGALDQVEYTFNVQGSVADGQFIPVEPVGESSGCPTSIQYLPKDLSSSPSVSATTCPAVSATAVA